MCLLDPSTLEAFLDMRLTDATDVALRVLIFAASKEGELFRIEELVVFYGLSRSTVMKVVNTLTRSKLLTAVRGRSGGLLLTRAAEDIRLGEVVRLMEPDFAMVQCLRPDNDRCVITSVCPLPTVLVEATTAFVDTLDNYTLADVSVGPLVSRSTQQIITRIDA